MAATDDTHVELVGFRLGVGQKGMTNELHVDVARLHRSRTAAHGNVEGRIRVGGGAQKTQGTAK